MSTLYSVLTVALTLSFVLSGDYGMDQSNDWPTKRVHTNTPRPTKWSPPSYDGMSWEKPSTPQPWKKTQKPTHRPTHHPTAEPTDSPTSEPTKKPTHHPTDEPTDSPTDEPTKRPSHNPTTRDPTKMPSPHPTTAHPTRHPTTSDPTKHPSHNPTTAWPTKRPSHQPTTMDPTKRPSESPTTSDPTRRPTSGTYLAPEPTKKPTHSPKQAWKKDSKPTWQKYDHETVKKEAVSHIYNPYDIRKRRSAMRAQLEERIESDMQELAALNELETVSDEQQDLDGEGVIEAASTFGFTNAPCSGRFDCRSGCCEGSRCVEKKRDWANIPYCPAECKGFPFARGGTC